MDLALSHSRSQRILRQRNVLGIVVIVLGVFTMVLAVAAFARNREIVLQPVLGSPVAISSRAVSRDYLELVTRDTAVLTLDRNPQNLDYWMGEVLRIASPRSQGRLRADLMKIVDEQRGSSIAQYFTIQAMTVDPARLVSEVTGQLHTIVGDKVISSETRTFRYTWEYAGLSLRLLGFGLVTPAAKAGSEDRSRS